MKPIGRGGMLIDHFVMQTPHQGDAIENGGCLRQVFADLDALDGRRNGVVVGPGLLLFGVSFGLGIERVDVTSSPPKPNENAVLGLALRHLDR